MKLIKNLNDLEIEDWVKVYDKDKSEIPFKMGEITHKWLEGHKPHFQLKVFETNLPLSTQQLIKRVRSGFKEYHETDDYTKGEFNNENKVFRLDKKERSKLMKEMILKNL